MLRTSLRSVRAVGTTPVAAAARQWQPTLARSPAFALRRSYADDKKPAESVKLPASESTTGAASSPPKSKLDAQAKADIKAVPPLPPKPAVTAQKTTSPPSPKKKRGFFGRLRRLVTTLILLGAIGFGGGVWYSRINDTFHDLFTAYVPYAEQAVLAVEEWDYRQRYRGPTMGSSGNKDTAERVKIPPSSGASWRVADSGEPGGRQSSAVRKVAESKKSASKADEKKEPVTESKPQPESSESAKRPVASADASATSDFKAPEVDEPSRFPPASPIDPLKVKDAEEPVVQDLVKMLNDIITVVNADNADDRYSATIGKAKNALDKVGSQIRDMKTKVEQDAAADVKSKVTEFEAAATELVTRVEQTMASQEVQWRAEFEGEMRKVRDAYESRMQHELEREKMVHAEKLQNQLLEQAVQLKRSFVGEIKEQVEAEREGRLGKLDQLSTAVRNLENLTASWNDVVDMNLRTQQLHVAVEAVRASLDDTDHPRPFVRELVALKEIAFDDQVVNAAIGSINPSAYQRGISTSSQLIDRFRRVASEVRKAALLPEDAGVASHASSWMLSKVMFKKQALPEGDDVESILTRTQTYLESGDLDAAAREMNGLDGWAKTLSRDWLGEVRKVLEVQQALEVIATEARLRSLRVE